MLAGWCSKYKDRISEVRFGFMYPALIVLIPISLIGFETDMGTAALLTCASLIILLVGGGNIRFFLGSGICSLVVLVPLPGFVDVEV